MGRVPFERANIGVIMMAGIVVNNAILLVDHVDHLRRVDGMRCSYLMFERRPEARRLAQLEWESGLVGAQPEGQPIPAPAGGAR